MSAGLLLIRLVVGVLLVGHGTQKLFGWLGGYGIEGTGQYFEGIGFRPGRTFAALAGVAETFGGLLLLLGLVQPLAAILIISAMITAIGSSGSHAEWTRFVLRRRALWTAAAVDTGRKARGDRDWPRRWVRQSGHPASRRAGRVNGSVREERHR
jgi:putative oxidoreductase